MSFDIFAEDYTPIPELVRISDGAREKDSFCVSIAVTDDEIFEHENETFSIILSTDDAAFQITRNEATAIIHDNDGLSLIIICI